MSDGRLFPVPTADLRQGLENLAGLLDKTFPLKAKHRAGLSRDIRELSEYLTSDRAGLPRDYMTRPQYLSAYLRWFLPWNVYRQGRLLQGLGLSLEPGARVLDFGSGPLTFAHALWLARRDLRDAEVNYLAFDRAEPVLKAGRRLWGAWEGSKSWQVRTESGRIPHKQADLLVLANVVNEMKPGRPDPEASPDEQMIARWERMTNEAAAVLVIEPGTRPAGRQIARLRQVALERGWDVAAPCPHANDCPQPGHGRGPWCHFTFTPEGAPDWLEKLAKEARLPKARASLSFLLLTRGGGGRVSLPIPPAADGVKEPVRLVSESFDLEQGDRGRYGCSEKGLVLLKMKEGRWADLPPGDLVHADFTKKSQKDRKSGARIVEL
jgi:hypothetical protein